MAKIPTTVITGFLGAGKTSLIRNLMTRAGGRRIALIINEFGDIGVDGDLLRGCGVETCRDEDIIELANGCICCTVADDFIPTMTRLLDRGAPDHIVIETSGLALPQPLIRAFAWPEIRTRVTVDGVITVVDGPAALAGQFAPGLAADGGHDETPLSELFEDQLACADLVVLSKTDLMDAGGLAAVEDLLAEHLRPAARVLRSGPAGLGADLLLGLGVSAEDDAEGRSAHHHDHGPGDAHDHGHDAFDSFVLDLPELADAGGLADRLAAVMADQRLLRLKGFAAVAGKPMRLVIQAVGPRVETHFDRPHTGPRGTRLVVIGESGLDRAAITAAVTAALAQPRAA